MTGPRAHRRQTQTRQWQAQNEEQQRPQRPKHRASAVVQNRRCELSHRAQLCQTLRRKYGKYPKYLPLQIEWKMGSLLGRGTFGSVFTALDTKSGMLIAIKRLSFCSAHSRQPSQARCAF